MIHFDHFISDPHFYHQNIIKFCSRPFAGVEEMNECLISEYKLRVKPTETTLWGGDCIFGKDKAKNLAKILRELPGRKVLILGNHDPRVQELSDIGFDFVAPEIHTMFCGVPTVFCHYPPANSFVNRHDERYEERKPKLRGNQICIHGHTHEKERVFPGDRRIHIGVDAWDYRPATFKELEEIVEEHFK